MFIEVDGELKQISAAGYNVGPGHGIIVSKINDNIRVYFLKKNIQLVKIYFTNICALYLRWTRLQTVFGTRSSTHGCRVARRQACES